MKQEHKLGSTHSTYYAHPLQFDTGSLIPGHSYHTGTIPSAAAIDVAPSKTLAISIASVTDASTLLPRQGVTATASACSLELTVVLLLLSIEFELS